VTDHGLAASDDGLHDPSDSFYDNETFWFSFFVPERHLGGWLYTGVRQHPGLTTGGLWIWDDSGVNPADIPFYENFSYLKQPAERGPQHLAFPNGMSVTVREPLMAYDLGYDDRDRVKVDLRFDAVEPPVSLRRGERPYPKAAHFDQTGHVTGTLTLDGERIEVDCHAMRDRSWGPRTERGYRRVGYTWLASPGLSVLCYTSPAAEQDEIHAGYLRRDATVRGLVGGTRDVQRDRQHGWVSGMRIDAKTDEGQRVQAEGVALSRMILPSATSLCINTAMRWTVEGVTIHGEDQDVWPLADWRTRLRSVRSQSPYQGAS
jgi:hypothetical protein